MNSLVRIAVWVVVVVLAGVLLASTSAVEARPILQSPPNPQPDPQMDSVYYGAVPPDNPNGPVLVFVHGYGGVADDWWTLTPYDELNDMYAVAYQAGYRTAFVSLGGSKGLETRSMWANGRKLSQQLEVIARHYGVNTMDIVAHSKGGVDAQASVVYYGGWNLVRRVFTLGSPHQGSELADLLYSDWAGWLAKLLGLQNEATYTLQTGYMETFRSMTDPRAATQNVIYYRAAGTDTGPKYSGLWISGLYLSLFGSNDGAVTVDSTGLSGARTLFIQPYHHFNIFLGHTAFPWIDAVLRGYDAQARRPNRAQVYLPFGATNATLEPSEPASRSRIILRGGQLEGTAMETVPVESGALNVTFDLLASNDAVTATLMTPDAQPRSLEVIPPRGDGFFGQAWQLVHSEDNPAPGQWKFVISGSNQAAYFLVAVIESPLEVTLRGWPGETVHPGDPLQLEAYASHPAGQPLLRRIEGRVARALPNGVGTLNVSTFNIQHSTFNVHLPGREGIYVISATVTGELPDGTPFERSFVRSVAAVTPDTLTGEPTLLDR